MTIILYIIRWPILLISAAMVLINAWYGFGAPSAFMSFAHAVTATYAAAVAALAFTWRKF